MFIWVIVAWRDSKEQAHKDQEEVRSTPHLSRISHDPDSCYITFNTMTMIDTGMRDVHLHACALRDMCLLSAAAHVIFLSYIPA